MDYINEEYRYFKNRTTRTDILCDGKCLAIEVEDIDRGDCPPVTYKFDEKQTQELFEFLKKNLGK